MPRKLPSLSAAFASCASLLSAQALPSIPAGQIVAVGQGDASITIADAVTGRVQATIDAGLRPDEVVASADGSRAFVMVYGGRQAGNEIATVALGAKPALAAVTKLPGLVRPHGCQVVDGKIWFTAETNSCVARFDPSTRSVDSIYGHGGAAGHMLAVAPDGRRIAVANMLSQDCSLIELGRNPRNVSRIKLPAPQPEGLAYSPNGREVWFGHRQGGLLSILEVESRKVVGTMEVGGVPFRLAFAKSGRLFFSDPPGRALVEVDPTKRVVVRRIELEGFPTGFCLHASGEWAAVSLADTNEAALLHLPSGSIRRRIPVGQHPDGICWASPPVEHGPGQTETAKTGPGKAKAKTKTWRD